MNRAELIEQAAAAWWEQAGSGQDWSALHENDPEAQWTRKAMAVVVDRIMPQVSTVAELEALPGGALVVAADGESWKLEDGEWWEHSRLVAFSADYLASHAPLTVVWRP